MLPAAHQVSNTSVAASPAPPKEPAPPCDCGFAMCRRVDEFFDDQHVCTPTEQWECPNWVIAPSPPPAPPHAPEPPSPPPSPPNLEGWTANCVDNFRNCYVPLDPPALACCKPLAAARVQGERYEPGFQFACYWKVDPGGTRQNYAECRPLDSHGRCVNVTDPDTHQLEWECPTLPPFAPPTPPRLPPPPAPSLQPPFPPPSTSSSEEHGTWSGNPHQAWQPWPPQPINALRMPKAGEASPLGAGGRQERAVPSSPAHSPPPGSGTSTSHLEERGTTAGQPLLAAPSRVLSEPSNWESVAYLLAGVLLCAAGCGFLCLSMQGKWTRSQSRAGDERATLRPRTRKAPSTLVRGRRAPEGRVAPGQQGQRPEIGHRKLRFAQLSDEAGGEHESGEHHAGAGAQVDIKDAASSLEIIQDLQDTPAMPAYALPAAPGTYTAEDVDLDGVD